MRKVCPSYCYYLGIYTEGRTIFTGATAGTSAFATFFHGYIGRASSFAKATEDKDARPSLGIGQLFHSKGFAADAPRRQIAAPCGTRRSASLPRRWCAVLRDAQKRVPPPPLVCGFADAQKRVPPPPLVCGFADARKRVPPSPLGNCFIVKVLLPTLRVGTLQLKL